MNESTAHADAETAFADELRNIVYQAEAALDAIADEGDETLISLRDRVHHTIDVAKARLAEMEGQAQMTTQRLAVQLEDYMRQHPWTAIAVGAGVGVLLGVLVARVAVGRGGAKDSATDTPAQTMQS